MNRLLVYKMKKIKKMKRFTYFVTCICCLLFAINLNAQITINLNPNTIREIGGYSEVQEVFGVMVGAMDDRAKPYLRDANITGIRQIYNWIPNDGTPGLNFRHPYWSTRSPKFDTEQETMDWFDSFIARDPSLWDGLLAPASGLLDDSFGSVNVTVSGNPSLFDGRLERNPDAAKAHIVAYVQALKNVRAQGAKSTLKTFQLANEPEQGRNWAGQFGSNQQLAIESYTRVYNILYDALQTAHPDVTFVATCVGHEGAFMVTERAANPGVIWDNWVKHFIDNVLNPKALEYYNAHCYNMPSVRNLAYVSLTQNYAQNTRGVRPRYIITETGAPVNNNIVANFRNQFIFMANDIMMMLHNPDKYAVRHAYVAASRDPETHAIFHSNPGGVTPQSQYYVLYTWRNLRGKIIDIEQDNKNISVFASLPEENKIVVALFNPENNIQTVSLNSRIPEEKITGIVHRKAIYEDHLINANYSEGTINPMSLQSIALEPHSVHAIEITMNSPLGETNTVRTMEYYGSKTNVSISVPVTLEIPVPELPSDNTKVILRVALERRHSLSAIYNINLNGHTYSFNLEDQPEPIINTWQYNAGLMEIPVNNEHISLVNTIQLPRLGNRVLLYSSLVYKEKAISGATSTEITDSPVLSVFPNPVSDVLYINNMQSDKPLGFSIYNIKGQKMYKRIIAPGADQFRIDVSDLPSGIYICRSDLLEMQAIIFVKK